MKTLQAPVSDYQPSVIILVILAAAFVWALKSVAFSRRKSRGPRIEWQKWRPSRPVETPFALPARRSMADPLQQQLAIEKVAFETQPLLNKSEARLLPLFELCAREAGRGVRVMAQTSLGEVIRPASTKGTQTERDEADAAINSKRLDFAFFDRSGTVILAIEYQGSGHYGRSSFMRDAVKREALRKAGVPLIEVPESQDQSLLKAQVQAILGPPDRP